MRWKQFFTPVRSLDAVEARACMDRNPGGGVTLLDVRQPEEYASGHLPGAKLVPLPELGERLAEIDAGKPVLVYCDIVSLAMSIEAQALDLYRRAAERADSAQGREVLARIADEERDHLKQLGGLFATLPAPPDGGGSPGQGVKG